MRSVSLLLLSALLLATAAILFVAGCVPPKVGMTAEEFQVPVDSADVASIVETPTDWMDDRLEEMTLEERVAQMITVRAFSYYYSDETEMFERLSRAVNSTRVGGVCIFAGDIYSAAVLLNRLQDASKVPLLISADFEWGAAMRLRRTTRFPEAMALGATRDTLLAFKMGLAVAREARAIGVHQVYAPVADVNVNPNNPVINTRSFGEDPRLVADMAMAFARGLQSGGVIATAKHFPGHGDTDVDSHLGLPVIQHTRARLDSVDFVPFRRLVQHGTASFMVGHFRVTALESGKNGRPATLSPPIVTGLLRREMGFEGLIVTDAMEMNAITNGYGLDSAMVFAVEAGNDILLLPTDEDAAIAAIVRAVRRGRLSEERINQSVRRILAMKQWVGLDNNRRVNVEAVPRVVASQQHTMLSKEIARSSVTLLKNDGVLPLTRNNNRKLLAVVVTDADDYRTEIHRPGTASPNERVGEYFSSLLRRRRGTVPTVRIDPSTNSSVIDSIIKQASRSDVLLVLIYSKARSASGRFGLPVSSVEALNRLMGLKKPSILVSMGSPFVFRSFPNANAYICSYSDAEPSTEATVEALFSEIPTRGRLPITIPGLFPYGTGIVSSQTALRRDLPENLGFIPDTLALVDSIVLRSMRENAFPGAQLVVVRDGAIIANNAYGTLDYSSSGSSVNTETMYDVASLTKVIATTSAVMRLYDDGLVNLDYPVIRYIPEFHNKGKEIVTVRNLLQHNGGLPAFKRLYMTARTPEEALDSVYQTELVYRVGDSTIYSDFSFIVLGKIVEKVSGRKLSDYVDSVFFKPLGMRRTMFNPPDSMLPVIAPTEFDSVLRKVMVRGIVHDENAYVLGGVSGHAGLFSTASDLAVLVQMLMNGGRYAGKQYLKPETVSLFTTRQDGKSTRALGWDTKTMNGYSSAGALFGEKSFGHTGFTGTSIWADPEKKLFVIFLTNRVHPTRNNSRIIQVRPTVHDAVARALNRGQSKVRSSTGK